jgi:hypothetical protein
MKSFSKIISLFSVCAVMTLASCHQKTECEKFLDSYESYLNRMIDLAQKAKKNPNDLSIVTEYTESALKASEFKNTKLEACKDDPDMIRKVLELESRLLTRASGLDATSSTSTNNSTPSENSKTSLDADKPTIKDLINSMTIKQITLWDLISEYMDDKSKTIRAYKGRRVWVMGWLNESDNGSGQISLMGTTKKPDGTYIMSMDWGSNKPADKGTGYIGLALCKLKQNATGLKGKPDSGCFNQEVIVSGVVSEITGNNEQVNFFGTLMSYVKYVVTLTDCEIMSIKDLTGKKVVSQTKSEETKDTLVKANESQLDYLKGDYKGAFGNDELLISITTIDKNDMVIGYNIVKGNKRAITGKAVSLPNGTTIFNLKEPGDDKWDGVFDCNLDASRVALSGTWRANNGKASKNFNLNKQ